MRKLFAVIGLLLVAVVAFGIYRTLTPPGDLYRGEGTLSPCPPRPSCVASAAEDPEQAVPPLQLGVAPEAAMPRLRRAVESLPGLHRLEVEGNYLHAVFQTPTMRYRDDLELLIGEDGRVSVRSLSRFGYRDFGVNRERVEALRAALAAG